MQYQKIQKINKTRQFSNTQGRMRINKVILIGRPILIALKKMVATLVLLGRDRSLLGTVLIADNAQQGHGHRSGVKRRNWGKVVKEGVPSKV